MYFTSLHFLKNWAPVSVSSSCTSTVIFMVMLFLQYSNLSCLGLISSTDTASILPLFFIAWILLLLPTSSLAVQFLASYSLTTTSCFSSWLSLLVQLNNPFKLKDLYLTYHLSISLTQQMPSPPYFPGGSDGKVSACNAGDPGSIPGSGRSPGEGNGNPLQYSCLENSMDGGAW